MIKEEYADKTFTKRIVVKKQIFCDCCGGLIEEYIAKDDEYETRQHDRSQQYYEVTTGHNDLGNESCESIKEYYYCSKECLRDAFNEYLELTNKAGYYGSDYFEIACKHS